MSGFIKLRRGLEDTWIFQDPTALAIFTYLLVRAEYRDREWVKAGKKHILKKGQLITGRKKIAAHFGLSESRVQRVLKDLEQGGVIEQQTNTRLRVISITKYDCGDDSEQQTTPKSDNKPPQSRPKSRPKSETLPKEIRIKKEEDLLAEEAAPLPVPIKTNKGKTRFDPRKSITSHQYQVMLEDPTLADGDRAWMFEQLKTMADWSANGNMKLDWAATFRNWMRSERKRGNVPNAHKNRNGHHKRPQTFQEIDQQNFNNALQGFLANGSTN